MAMAMRIGSTGQHSLPACAETWLKWEIAYRLYTPQPTPNVDDDEDDEDEDDGGGSGGGNIDPDDDEGWSDDEDDEDDETLWTAPPRGYPAATLYAIAAGTSCASRARSCAMRRSSLRACSRAGRRRGGEKPCWRASSAFRTVSGISTT